MPSVPAPPDPGRDEDPAWPGRDPMTAAEREAWLDRLCAQDDDPSDAPEEYWDPESSAPLPGEDELTAGELAGVAEAASDEMLALDAASTGRRGPGQAGSARVFPGESASRAAGFGAGMAWDVTPGCAQLAVAADAAVAGGAGPVTGSAGWPIMSWSGWCAPLTGPRPIWPPASWWRSRRCSAATRGRVERRPGGCPPWCRVHPGPAGLRVGESRAAADWLLTVAWHLATRLDGTLGALRDGIITRGKAELIVRLTQYLSDDEARAAEAKIVAGPGG